MFVDLFWGDALGQGAACRSFVLVFAECLRMALGLPRELLSSWRLFGQFVPRRGSRGAFVTPASFADRDLT